MKNILFFFSLLALVGCARERSGQVFFSTGRRVADAEVFVVPAALAADAASTASAAVKKRQAEVDEQTKADFLVLLTARDATVAEIAKINREWRDTLKRLGPAPTWEDSKQRTGEVSVAAWARLTAEWELKTKMPDALTERATKLKGLETEIEGLRAASGKTLSVASRMLVSEIALRPMMPEPAARTDADGRFAVKIAAGQHLIVMGGDGLWFVDPERENGPLMLTERNAALLTL